MLRAKRRRTRMYDSEGNPIFNTMNSTSLQSVYKNQNTYLKKLNENKCNTSCECNNCVLSNYNSNPILGYRKQLYYTVQPKIENSIFTSESIKAFCNLETDTVQKKQATFNTIYKDNYAKTCATNEVVCYPQTIKKKQNRNGLINDKYNYSTNQYLERRCRTFKDQEFNFLSNMPIENTKKSEFFTACTNSNIEIEDTSYTPSTIITGSGAAGTVGDALVGLQFSNGLLDPPGWLGTYDATKGLYVEITNSALAGYVPLVGDKIELPTKYPPPDPRSGLKNCR